MAKELRGCTFSCYDGVSKYVRVEGYFHEWGSVAEEGKEGTIGTNSVAIVEDKEGEVYQIDPSQIKFTEFTF